MNNGLIFITNQTTTPRRETLGGREYLVVPVVAIKEGVWNRELVTAQEIAAGFGSWNGRPIMRSPPLDENGQYVAANVHGGKVAGRLFNVNFIDNKLKGEMWLELATQSASAMEAIKRLDGGMRVEVSTAYWRDVENASGIFNGVRYDAIAHNLKPDHLAILLGSTGACSWAKGCGAPRVNAGGGLSMNVDIVNILSEARRPTFDGTTDAPWEKPTVTQFVAAMSEDIRPESNQVGDMSNVAKSWIANHTLLGDPNADNERDLTFFAVVTPQGRLSNGALRAVIGGRGAQADISQSAKDSAQSIARGLLEKEFGMKPKENQELEPNQDDEERMAKVAMLLEDGRIAGLTEELLAAAPFELLDVLVQHLEAMDAAGNQQDNDEPEHVPPEPPATNQQEVVCPKLLELVEKLGGAEIALNMLNAVLEDQHKERAALIEQLTTNSILDADVLQAFDTATLNKLVSNFIKRPDYSGQGDGTPVTNEETAVELPPLSTI